MDTANLNPANPANFFCCGKSFKYRKVLKMHKEAMHQFSNKTHILENVQLKENSLCPHCGSSFSTNSTLKAHIKNLYTGVFLLCPKCEYKTRNPGTLKLHHKLRHTEESKLSCMFCGKVVKDLQRHLKVTLCGKDKDESRKLQCQKCSSQFKLKHLKNHMKIIHEEIKDNMCPHCSYATYSSYNLRLHVKRVHEKAEMLEQCPYCEKRSGHLKWHLDTYHSEQGGDLKLLSEI